MASCNGCKKGLPPNWPPSRKYGSQSLGQGPAEQLGGRPAIGVVLTRATTLSALEAIRRQSATNGAARRLLVELIQASPS